MSSEPELIRMAQEIDQHLTAVRQILRQPIDTMIASGGLTGPQRSVMQALVHSGGLSLKDLSRKVGLAHSTVSGIVDRLVKRGLLTREADSVDRRFSRIVASDVVRNYLRDQLPALLISPMVGALRNATPEQRASILDGLRTLRELLKRTHEIPSDGEGAGSL